MEDAYTTLAGKLGYGRSERLKRILRKLMSEEEASLAASLPATLQELSSRLGKPSDEIDRQLGALFTRGVVFMTSKGYQFARDMTQLHDATADDTRLDVIYGNELLDLWREFRQEEWFSDRARALREVKKPFWKIIPARRAIAPGSKILPMEDLEGILERATRLAVVSCPCRRVARSCNRPLEVCLQLNRAAEYTINRGAGRELTKEEAMEVLETAEDGGLIHCAPNLGEVTSAICNCCTDCCDVFYPLIKYGGLEKGVLKSQFQAKTNQSLCTGCQDCVERCPFDAIEMIRVVGEKKLKAKVDSDRCYGCGVCAVGCKTEAIKLVEVRPPEQSLV